MAWNDCQRCEIAAMKYLSLDAKGDQASMKGHRRPAQRRAMLMTNHEGPRVADQRTVPLMPQSRFANSLFHDATPRLRPTRLVGCPLIRH
jgi:hypothetical protein